MRNEPLFKIALLGILGWIIYKSQLTAALTDETSLYRYYLAALKDGSIPPSATFAQYKAGSYSW